MTCCIDYLDGKLFGQIYFVTHGSFQCHYEEGGSVWVEKSFLSRANRVVCITLVLVHTQCQNTLSSHMIPLYMSNDKMTVMKDRDEERFIF